MMLVKSKEEFGMIAPEESERQIKELRMRLKKYK